MIWKVPQRHLYLQLSVVPQLMKRPGCHSNDVEGTTKASIFTVMSATLTNKKTTLCFK